MSKASSVGSHLLWSKDFRCLPDPDGAGGTSQCERDRERIRELCVRMCVRETKEDVCVCERERERERVTEEVCRNKSFLNLENLQQ